MIELTIFVDSYPMQFVKTFVMLDQVTHIKEAPRSTTTIEFANKKSITVGESIYEVEKKFRDYAERSQAERISAMIADEIAKQLPNYLEKLGS